MVLAGSSRRGHTRSIDAHDGGTGDLEIDGRDDVLTSAS